MKKYKFIILGAGPSGLALAQSLLDKGFSQDSFLILEKEGEAGGLCKSSFLDGSPIDSGGGHFLDTRKKDVLKFLFRFMPESEWNTFKRISKINIFDSYVDYPLESNLWQLPSDKQIDFIESISRTTLMNEKKVTPKLFEDYIKWKFGAEISNHYMLPYNRKIWSCNLNSLGTYWLHKLPNVTLRDTLRSIVLREASGAIPAHANFLYPKNFGYGELWNRMAGNLQKSLILNYRIYKIDLKTLTINDEFRAEKIITSIPWHSWLNFSEINQSIRRKILKLKYTSIDIDYYGKNLQSDAHWIYEPSETISNHRILVRHNFISKSKGYWTETNSLRSPKTQESMMRFHNEFAYPINTKDKLDIISTINTWANKLNIYGLGRWGKWEHMNSDVAVEEALFFAAKLKNI
ncbi:amine oxidoreductase [Candidatus Methylopumilus universalis]|uniref:FAD-dependent oxidoreductase n=1 Tax=Candidatus Methylopumilus universalis TaxID=2588536 RepID=UPI0011226C1D|nr:FAD-dependent oxidoreductase [Candidatus Methylopumilus universalis]QDC70734.1 amine oxidoreductase [Candidatus Methylopumilus universalis]